MGLFGLRKKAEEEEIDVDGIDFENLSNKDKEAVAGLGASLVGKDPGAFTDAQEWSHFAMTIWMDKNYPCEQREYAILDSKGRPVEVTKLMDIYCDAKLDGKREHGFRRCLNCPVIGSKVTDFENLLQIRRYMENPDAYGESGGGGEVKVEMTPEEYAKYQEFLKSKE